MPISEILNALLITYIATEYSVASSSSLSSSSLEKKTKTKKKGFLKAFVQSPIHVVCIIIVIVWNIFDSYYDWNGISTMMKHGLEQLLHLPKIVLAALLYMTVLYFDCLRHTTTTTTSSSSRHRRNRQRHQQCTFFVRFLKHVGYQFLYILPIYPFLAVLISFGFMFVITAMEYLHVPLEWLNGPIYYGTLYGPFSLVYFKVKHTILQEEEDASYFIPSHYSDYDDDFEYDDEYDDFNTKTTIPTRKLPSDFFQRLSSSDSNNNDNHDDDDDDGNYHERQNRMATIRDLRLMKLEPMVSTTSCSSSTPPTAR